MYISRTQSRIIAVVIVAAFLVTMAFSMQQVGKSSSSSETIDHSEEHSDGEVPREKDLAAQTSSETPDTPSEGNVASADPGTSPSEDARVALKEFRRTETRDGVVIWDVRGTGARFFPEDNSVLVKSGVLDLRDKNGKRIRITAEEAKISIEGTSLKKAHAYDGVTINYDDRLHMVTDVATYDLIEEKIHAPGKVEIKDAFREIRGEELEGDVGAREFTIRRNVETVLLPKHSDERKDASRK